MPDSRKWFELGPFTVFDVETTGMSPSRDRIVELAAIRMETDGALSRFHHLVNPGRAIPRGVQTIHHISDEMVVNAPRFHEIGYNFLDFAEGSTLVGHNARFDLGFLQESLYRESLPLWQGKTLDTLKLSRRVFKNLPGYSLQSLRRQFKLDAEGDDLAAHRAFADVEWTLRLLEKLFTELLNQ
ncbi:MAG: PolC-type DNA polymerase III [Victivallaceae bacterium]|nr:3'-5' exonuclease [Victivallaceae bacterium]